MSKLTELRKQYEEYTAAIKKVKETVPNVSRQQAVWQQAGQSKMLYRRMRLICNKPIAEMNQGKLEKVWMWVRKEYGTEGEKK